MVLQEKVLIIRGMLKYLKMSVLMFATYLQVTQENKNGKCIKMLAVGESRVECLGCSLTSFSVF